MQHDVGIASRSFGSGAGGLEHFISVEASADLSFAGQLNLIRPEWLIEVEGVAVVANHAPRLPAF